MRKINILTKSVYNRISAGEVIDRPYSAVKELIENSLDAGATEIEIYIERGGKQLIKVVDNGGGIERDDMRAAFFPHATSKITCADDISGVKTLGFRGEALASISVIAKVELTSVTAGNNAYKVYAADDKISDVEPAALDCGTVVCVRDLFYNTPVRAKFLKPDKKEETDITSFVTRYVLGNPYVSFKYYVDGKLALSSFGGGLDEAIAQVYGAKVIPQCFKIKAEKDGIKLSGYIGNQNFFKPNKSYQSIFLNGRYITNYTIATAISNAYSAYAMKRQYPFYVLNIDVPYDMVDVNVHPNKADVRFIDNNLIFGTVYKIVSSVLDGTARAAEFVVDSLKIPEIKSTIDENPNKVLAEPPTVKINGFTESRPNVSYTVNPTGTATYDTNSAMKESKIIKKDIKYRDPQLDKPIYFSGDRHISMSVESGILPRGSEGDIQGEIYSVGKSYEQEKIKFESCKYKGNLFNTYLIYESGDTVFLIDQHAAHERLIYDRLREQIANRKINRQSLIIPYLFGVNAQEKEFVENNIDLIRSLGFDLKPFGVYSYRVDEVPADLEYINLEDFFNDLLAGIDKIKEIKMEDLLKDKIAMTACKHAVKGGMELTDEEIKELFRLMNGNVGLKCPHGRPVCVMLEKKDVEKMFKRIV